MSKALKQVSNKNVSVQEKAKATQVKNSTGGFVFEITPVSRLERFLILGTDSPTYYASSRDLTRQNYDFLVRMAQSDATTLVDTVVAVSDAGRAPKNSPAIFAMAVAITNAPEKDKAYVRNAVAKVCRTSTHLFEFAQYVENLGGWGRSKRSAVASWYESKTADQLAYQAVKYRQRDGWTHRDLLRLSHPSGLDVNVVNFILGKDVEASPRVIEGFVKAQAATDVKTLIGLVTEYNLPWEAVPTQFLREPALWKAFIDNRTIGQTAILRNVRRMDEIGAFKDRTFAKSVVNILTDPEEIRKGRLHPIAFLNAHGVYKGGEYGRNGDNMILGALEDGFYAAFGNIEPANARTLVALDVSGSMGMGEIGGLKGLNPRQAAAAMATVTVRSEPDVLVKGFSRQLCDIAITKNSTFEDAIRKTSNLPFEWTDVSLPFKWALANKVEIDVFYVYTDNEVNHGEHPYRALQKYRNAMGINAQLVVVGLTTTNFTVAVPDDNGMLDVVGFDSAAPKVMADFARNR